MANSGKSLTIDQLVAKLKKHMPIADEWVTSVKLEAGYSGSRMVTLTVTYYIPAEFAEEEK